MLEPVSSTTALGAAIVVIRLLGKSFQVKDVGEQTKDFLSAIERMDRDLQYALRLREQLEGRISALQKDYVDRALGDAEDTLKDMTLILDKFRIDHETRGGRVRIRHKVAWMLFDSQNLRDKAQRINSAHTSLCSVLSILNSLYGTSLVDTGGNKGSVNVTFNDVTINPILVPSQGNNNNSSGYSASEIEDMLAWRQSTMNISSGDQAAGASQKLQGMESSSILSDLEDMLEWRRSTTGKSVSRPGASSQSMSYQS